MPVAEAAYERLLTLPLHAGMTDGDVDDVVRALDKVAEAYTGPLVTDEASRRSSGPVTVAVIQARMGSTRLRGKVLEPIEDAPLLAWTIREFARSAACRRSSSRPPPIPPTTPSRGSPRICVGVHRGSTHDVLRRCLDAVEAFEPEVVIRQTADNPSPTLRWPRVRSGRSGRRPRLRRHRWLAARHRRRGLPLPGAGRREQGGHRSRRSRTRDAVPLSPARAVPVGRAPRADSGRAAAASARYTVDTEPDLAFARALAAQLSAGPPVSLAVLEAIIEDDPALLEINAGVAQKPWGTSQLAEEARWTS